MFDRIIGGVELHQPPAAWTPPDKGPLFSVFVPERVYCSMGQHLGNPCLPRVAVGDVVAKGQIVGECEHGVCAPVHASVSGKVTAIRDMPLPGPGGKKAPAVVIENDGKNRMAEFIGKPSLADSRSGIAEAVRRAGVVGMGGAAFPSQIKLGVEGKDIDLVILNGAECEPLMWGDDILMRARSERVLSGCRVMMRVAGAEQAIIAIEKNKPLALVEMRRICAGDDRIKVRSLPERYPAGGEKQLIYYLTGREYPNKSLPSDCGVVLFNVATAAAVADAVSHSRPLTDRFYTVTGAVARPRVLEMPIGCLISDVVRFCGGFTADPVKVVVGGPMMGKAVDSPDTPLMKASAGILVIPREHDRTGEKEYLCIRCNRCVDTCPMALMPYQIDRCFRRADWDGCKRLQTPSCINCGCCSYVCPARIPLAANITDAGQKLKKMEGDEK